VKFLKNKFKVINYECNVEIGKKQDCIWAEKLKNNLLPRGIGTRLKLRFVLKREHPLFLGEGSHLN